MADNKKVPRSAWGILILASIATVIIGAWANDMFSTGEKFYLNAGQEIPTVMVGEGTFHRIWANNPWEAISNERSYIMPAGWSTWKGSAPTGSLGARGVKNKTVLKFE